MVVDVVKKSVDKDHRHSGVFSAPPLATSASNISHPANATGGKLASLEMARGAAAIGVVLFHANAAAREFNGPYVDILSFGAYGVDFFFVLSGFIIFFVHGEDLGHPEKAKNYALKRAVRIFPLLWLVVFSLALGAYLVAGRQPEFGTVISSLFIYPSLEPSRPTVVWTLRHELLFYLAFLIGILSRRIGLLIWGSWFAAAVGQMILSLSHVPVGGLPAFFLSAYQLDFVLGALIAHMYRKSCFPSSYWPFTLASVFLLGVLVTGQMFGIHRTDLADYVSFAAIWWTPLIGLAFAGVVFGLLCLEAKVRIPPFLVLLGSASYSIYLVHTPVNSITQRVAHLFPEPTLAIGLGHVFVVCCGVAVGVAVHTHIEKPIGRWLRESLLPRLA